MGVIEKFGEASWRLNAIASSKRRQRGEEVMRLKVDARFARFKEKHRLHVAWDQTIGAAAILFIGPAADTDFTTASHLRDALDATAKGDDARCRFHGRKIAIFARFWQGANCDYRSYMEASHER